MLFYLQVDHYPVRLVRSTDAQLAKAMWAYIRKERAKGRELANIVYCWTPAQVEKAP
jgi:hypothetical protein